jgi:dTDP-4-dehydrorhamnose 3,5-epimerase-like enzyme
MSHIIPVKFIFGNEGVKVEIPNALNPYFLDEHFGNYPIVDIPQFFTDDRGSIFNIADGRLGDVAVINSKANSLRANHIHKKDWHLSYLVEGEIKYFWEEDSKQKSMVIKPGELFYTPPQTPHKMLFLKESIFIAVAAMSRTQENYENDTTRLEDGHFN